MTPHVTPKAMADATPGVNPEPTHPARYSRRVLLAVAGLSPQILTETLYALAQSGREAFIPTEIYLITTVEGANRARLMLLSEKPGWFHRLRREYALPEIDFPPENIRLIHDADGTPLDDIRSASDNDAAADSITNLVRELTAAPGSALHVSLAGGRKTMGFYLGYAMSLYGRPQDRLSHVLVSSPFESDPQFFYPSRASRVLTTRDGRPVDARDARVTLAQIPFVRLRDGLPKHLLTGTQSFTATVNAAQRGMAAPRLVLHSQALRVIAADIEVPMRPAEMAFYLWLAERRQAGLPSVNGMDAKAGEILAIYKRLVGPLDGGFERASAALAAEGMTKQYFEQRKSRINRILTDTLGPSACQSYLIHSEGARPKTRFGLLGLLPAQIDITAQRAESAKRPPAKTIHRP